MKELVSKKITAYGFRKPGTVCIIHLLNDTHGYSRKYSVLEIKAIKQLRSKAKFINGFRELRDIGFVKILHTNQSKRIKLDKRLWERDPSIIKFEHQLIYERLNKNARWINKKSLIREIRNKVEVKTTRKPPYYAVDVHLKFILSQNKYSENVDGLIRLSKFDGTNKNIISKGNRQSSLLDLDPQEKLNSIENDNILESDEIDFDRDVDIFDNLNQDTEKQNVSVIEKKSIDQDIFGNSIIDDEREESEDVTTSNTDLKNTNHFNNFIPQDSLLEEIASELKKYKHFKISESYCEVSLVFNGLEIIIEYDPFRHELLVSTSYDISTDYLLASLKMFSKAEMIGQLAIDNIKNVDYLILKHKTSIIKYSLQEIMSRIKRIIYEAIQLHKLSE